MADIDKSLPNQKTTVKLPGEEESEERKATASEAGDTAMAS